MLPFLKCLLFNIFIFTLSNFVWHFQTNRPKPWHKSTSLSKTTVIITKKKEGKEDPAAAAGLSRKKLFFWIAGSSIRQPQATPAAGLWYLTVFSWHRRHLFWISCHEKLGKAHKYSNTLKRLLVQTAVKSAHQCVQIRVPPILCGMISGHGLSYPCLFCLSSLRPETKRHSHPCRGLGVSDLATVPALKLLLLLLLGAIHRDYRRRGKEITFRIQIGLLQFLHSSEKLTRGQTPTIGRDSRKVAAVS